MSSIKEAIRAIVLAGGTIKHPYKEMPEDLMGDVTITHNLDYNEKEYIVRWATGHAKLKLDEAIQVFGCTSYSKNNFANAIIGIQRHNLLPNCDLDDLTEEELKTLTDRYWVEFYDKDFPFASEFDKE